MLPHREALYGGAAGGGKSDALLMCALQYVDVPHYSALLLRRSFSDLMQPGGLLHRALEWRDSYWGNIVKYDRSQHTFTFPSSATITFGYIGDANTQERYQGGEYHFIGWDELTQHHPYYYTYLFSRNRKKQCQFHAGRIIDGVQKPLPDDPSCRTCREFGPSSRLPLRIRAATNPGGRGGEWVKERFYITKDKESGLWYGSKPDTRPFISSKVTDNPFLSQQEYIDNLMQLPEGERNQLLYGDWGFHKGGRFKPQWARTYTRKGDYYILPDRALHKAQLHIITVADIAGSLRTGAGEPDPEDPYSHPFLENRRASHTVLSTWGITSHLDLLLLDIDRMQVEAPEILSRARTVCKEWSPAKFIIETNGPGLPVAQLAQSMGIPVVPLYQTRDKVANSFPAQVRMEAGKIYLPSEDLNCPWLEKYRDELFSWTGHPHEVDDQVDVTSNAVQQVMLMAPGDMYDTNLSYATETIVASDDYTPVYAHTPLLPDYTDVPSYDNFQLDGHLN